MSMMINKTPVTILYTSDDSQQDVIKELDIQFNNKDDNREHSRGHDNREYSRGHDNRDYSRRDNRQYSRDHDNEDSYDDIELLKEKNNMELQFLRDHLKSTYDDTIQSMNEKQNHFKVIIEDAYNDLKNKYQELFERFEKERDKAVQQQ